MLVLLDDEGQIAQVRCVAEGMRTVEGTVGMPPSRDRDPAKVRQHPPRLHPGPTPLSLDPIVGQRARTRPMPPLPRADYPPPRLIKMGHPGLPQRLPDRRRRLAQRRVAVRHRRRQGPRRAGTPEEVSQECLAAGIRQELVRIELDRQPPQPGSVADRSTGVRGEGRLRDLPTARAAPVLDHLAPDRPNDRLLAEGRAATGTGRRSMYHHGVRSRTPGQRRPRGSRLSTWLPSAQWPQTLRFGWQIARWRQVRGMGLLGHLICKRLAALPEWAQFGLVGGDERLDQRRDRRWPLRVDRPDLVTFQHDRRLSAPSRSRKPRPE